MTRSSDSLPCHAATRLDRVLPRAVCIVDSEVSFCFVMIMICNNIMIVIILIINIINIKPASEIYMDGNVPLTITSIDIFSPYSYLTIQL